MKRISRRFTSYMAVAFAACHIVTVAVQAETITGRFRYSDFNPNNSTSRMEPIRLCKVEIWGRRPRTFGFWSWGKDADTTTDINGNISVNIPFQTAGVDYAVKISAQNYAAIVWPNNASRGDGAARIRLRERAA